MATSFRSRARASRVDLARMRALASARLAIDWPAVRFHPGDVDWWVVQSYGRSPGLEERLRLWFRVAASSEDAPDALRAYAWFGLPGDLDFVIASDEPAELDALIAEIVAWGEERLTTVATESQAWLRVYASSRESAATSLAALGFVVAPEGGYVHLTGDLSIADSWRPPLLPDGFAVRPLASNADVEARVACGRAAFVRSTMTVERYRTTFGANLYRRDLDLLMVDRDGRVVAFALGWLDPVTGVVELEPVGVHPDFHRRGLGRQICQATLRRARELGAVRALIAAERDNPAAVGLYQSLGLAITTEIVPHVRPRQVR